MHPVRKDIDLDDGVSLSTSNTEALPQNNRPPDPPQTLELIDDNYEGGPIPEAMVEAFDAKSKRDDSTSEEDIEAAETKRDVTYSDEDNFFAMTHHLLERKLFLRSQQQASSFSSDIINDTEQGGEASASVMRASSHTDATHVSVLEATLVQGVEATIISERTSCPVYEATLIQGEAVLSPQDETPYETEHEHEPSNVSDKEEEDDEDDEDPDLWKRYPKITVTVIILLVLIIVMASIGVAGAFKDEEVAYAPLLSATQVTSQEPTRSPTSMSPSVSLGPTGLCSYWITIAVLYDDNPHESSWYLYRKKSDKNILIKSHSGWHGDANIVHTESFCVQEGEYNFTITDTASDGLCCGLEGNGMYNVSTDGGVLIVEGGEFKKSESTLFLIPFVPSFIPSLSDKVPDPTEVCSWITIAVTYDDYPHESVWFLSQMKTDRNILIKSHRGWHGDQKYKEAFCLQDGMYNFTMVDKGKDGICCGIEGDGHYSVTSPNGVLIAEGGDFEETETTIFSIPYGPSPPFPTTAPQSMKSLVALPTKAPSLPPISQAPSTSPIETLYCIQVAVVYDDAPWQTSWDLRTKDGEEIAFVGPGLSGDTNHTKNICLNQGRYKFTIYDNNRDGLCCNNGAGYYNILTSVGEIIVQGSMFGESESTSFNLPYTPLHYFLIGTSAP